MNKFERMIATVSPSWALKRQASKQKLNILNSGYGNHGGSRTKKSLVGWIFGGGSPEEDINANLDTLRQRSRDLFMGGAALATGALKTARTNVVGTGLRLKPTIDTDFLGLSEEEAENLKGIIEREWKLWSEKKDCDAMRMNNFVELQQLAFLSQLMSGDCFVLLPMNQRPHSIYDLRVRIIEADRCCNPENNRDERIKSGVEVNDQGEVVAYHFVNKHPLSTGFGKKKWERVEAIGKKTGRTNVLHLMESERPEQRRGVPILAPVIEALKQLGRYTEAELMAAVVSGMFTVFIKAEQPNMPMGEGIDLEDRIDDDNETSYELGSGSIIGLNPGESIETANPGRPNTAFDGFVTSILRQVGAALEIPYELLVKHFTSSYSASRAALLEAWKMFRMRRNWLAYDFCQPIYEEWFGEAVAKGRIHAPGFFDDPLIKQAYTQAEWHGPTQGQIDPLKEAKAAQLRISECLSTIEREAAEMNGSDSEQNIRQRSREERLKSEGGIQNANGTESAVLVNDEERGEE
ncbi:phage portal protein [Brevibacillus laterosporus]|uniref:phage portal protein n=1 Tax=Brevibacillus laterosporus TaxID=1465 RepID=UPI0018CCFB61|nr:phage portal protein [Brevibacillus laterosporus]MBG9799523.1 portal protein [Brevibacillus laterosporus]MED1909756.1 phage portal protein [Brevibacillus laterosporus]